MILSGGAYHQLDQQSNVNGPEDMAYLTGVHNLLNCYRFKTLKYSFPLHVKHPLIFYVSERVKKMCPIRFD